ncbi:hypothetical protein HBI42_213010 [Parastagonospora nodorum]|nr:hypothetical protein HBI43_176750 [Parastagonospora nodorum]KAH6243849.1 hypothetical protein HBI42_213010 [Parastagonospora nodorum]
MQLTKWLCASVTTLTHRPSCDTGGAIVTHSMTFVTSHTRSVLSRDADTSRLPEEGDPAAPLGTNRMAETEWSCPGSVRMFLYSSDGSQSLMVKSLEHEANSVPPLGPPKSTSKTPLILIVVSSDPDASEEKTGWNATQVMGDRRTTLVHFFSSNPSYFFRVASSKAAEKLTSSRNAAAVLGALMTPRSVSQLFGLAVGQYGAHGGEGLLMHEHRLSPPYTAAREGVLFLRGLRYRGRVGTFSGLRGVGGVRAGEGRRFTVHGPRFSGVLARMAGEGQAGETGTAVVEMKQQAWAGGLCAAVWHFQCLAGLQRR